MLARSRWIFALLVLASAGPWLMGQEAGGKRPTQPAADVVAATVNGQKVPELAVFRALCKANPPNYEAARKEVVNYLVDNVLVDQYLVQLKIDINTKELEQKIEQIKSEANKKDPGGFDKILKNLFLTEVELRKEMSCALRWDRFVQQQATEPKLKEMFQRNTNMFDGSQMRARHILVKLAQAGPAETATKVASIKKQIEEDVATELAKGPDAKSDKARTAALDKVFARVAGKESSCPSKENGGDLGWFPRAGAMVEPFARAAFALKPYQLSEPIATEFGYHLILATDQKPGKEVKFDDVKPYVQEVYSERLREAVIAAMRPQSKISVNAGK